MAKSLQKALTALLLLAPAWLFAAPRVVTLSPANTELAFAAGITPVGVSSYSDYPPAAAKIEEVASWQGMNLERIVALKPDLVLAWRGGNAERQVNQLSSLGIKVIWVETGSIEQIISALQMLAPWSPEPETARQAAQKMQDDYLALKARYANAPKKRVFLQFGANPLFTSNSASIQNQVLSLCGGENILPPAAFPGRRSAANRCCHGIRRRSSSPATPVKFPPWTAIGKISSQFRSSPYIATGLNARAHVLSLPQNNSVLRLSR